jgi:hypothetical protein
LEPKLLPIFHDALSALMIGERFEIVPTKKPVQARMEGKTQA